MGFWTYLEDEALSLVTASDHALSPESVRQRMQNQLSEKAARPLYNGVAVSYWFARLSVP